MIFIKGFLDISEISYFDIIPSKKTWLHITEEIPLLVFGM